MTTRVRDAIHGPQGLVHERFFHCNFQIMPTFVESSGDKIQAEAKIRTRRCNRRHAEFHGPLNLGYRVERTHARALEAPTVSELSALRIIHADGLFVAVAR